MFDSAVKIVSALDAKTAEPYVDRLAAVVRKAEGIGWGYYDCIADRFFDSFPDEEKPPSKKLPRKEGEE